MSRHRKPWVKRPYVSKPCTPTRSRSTPFYARSGSYVYGITSIRLGVSSNSYEPFSNRTITSTGQSFTSECSSKYVETQDVVWDGEVIDLSYPRYKNCTNERTELFFQPGTPFVHRSYGTHYGVKMTDIFIDFTGNPTMPDRMPTSIDRAYLLGYVKNPSSYASQAASAATAAIKQRLLTDNALLNFREVFSVLTFIAELKDLRNLPALLKKWTKTTHDVSDKFLGIQFGVLPFYSDIMAILNRLNNLGTAIDEWNAAAQECNTRAYHVTVPLGPGLGTLEGPGTYVKQNSFASSINHGAIPLYINSHVTSVQNVKCKAHVYLIPRAIPSHLVDELKRRIWGVDKPLSTVWELVPFSFVVDWFLKIGNIIDEFEREAPLLQYRILSAGYSLKVDTVVIHGEGRSLDDSDLGGLTLHHTLYKRVALPITGLLSPNKIYELGFHTIDSKQTLIGTALLHQLLR